MRGLLLAFLALTASGNAGGSPRARFADTPASKKETGTKTTATAV